MKYNKKHIGGDDKRKGNSSIDAAKTAVKRAADYWKGTGRGSFGGGSTSGAGVSLKDWGRIPTHEVTDTITNVLSINETFNNAFARARRNNQSEFTFDGKRYTTELGDNPNNTIAGNLRTQNIAMIPTDTIYETRRVNSDKEKGIKRNKIVPVVIDKKKLGGTGRFYTINGNIKNKLGVVPSTVEESKVRQKALLGLDKSSAIGAGLNVAGNIASVLINNSMLNRLKRPTAPINKQAVKLKTRINIQPQLDKMRETLAAYERDIDANTLDSNVGVARKQYGRFANMLGENELVSKTQEQERELINKDKLNRQGIMNDNITAYNEYKNKLTDFDNQIIEKKSENIIAGINNLTDAYNTALTNTHKAQLDKVNALAIASQYPHSIDYFYNLGLIDKDDYAKLKRNNFTISSSFKGLNLSPDFNVTSSIPRITTK